jgi:hypothetical protein
MILAMPIVRIEHEEEQPAGWLFQVEMLDNDGQSGMTAVTLSWADYDLWCPGGSMPPHAVIEAVVLFLLSKGPLSSVRSSFDASLARRLYATADADIPGMICRS